jgi:hypothetical protein
MAIIKITSSGITDGTIATADIADSAIATAKIADSAVTSVKTSGVGGANTPAFMAYASADQSISNGVYTKVQCNTEIYDTDNAYDNSTNYRFTPQTAGKYYFFAQTRYASPTDFDACVLAIRKNGSAYYDMTYRNEYYDVGSLFGIADMNGSSDYLEFFVEQGSGTTRSLSGSDATRHMTKFGAYKIIE